MSTEEKILEAALAEFAAHGLEGGRVDRIAERAGINKAMIYYHFDSKEKLYESIIREHVIGIKALLTDSLDKTENLEELLLKLARFYASLLEADSGYREIFLRELAGGGDYVRRVLLQITRGGGAPRRLKALLDKGKRDGRYRQVDSRQAIISFIGMNMFYLLAAPIVNEIWGLRNDDVVRRKRPEAVVDLFLRGLEAR
jgi:TetR/AcrR family transcriptional regulator